MPRKYLAFDIETAKILPEDFGDLHDHRPLGITCTATWRSDESAAVTFYSKNEDRSPAPQMTTQDLTAFVEHLKMGSSWNGVGKINQRIVYNGRWTRD